MDKEMQIIETTNSASFMDAVNELLSQGIWRVVHTEVYVTSNMYLAILIRKES